MRSNKDFKPNVVGYTFEDLPYHKITHSVGISREFNYFFTIMRIEKIIYLSSKFLSMYLYMSNLSKFKETSFAKN